jgi:hypothetical protein
VPRRASAAGHGAGENPSPAAAEAGVAPGIRRESHWLSTLSASELVKSLSFSSLPVSLSVLLSSCDERFDGVDV